jgi:hypothetical protein
MGKYVLFPFVLRAKSEPSMERRPEGAGELPCDGVPAQRVLQGSPAARRSDSRFAPVQANTGGRSVRRNPTSAQHRAEEPFFSSAWFMREEKSLSACHQAGAAEAALAHVPCTSSTVSGSGSVRFGAGMC